MPIELGRTGKPWAVLIRLPKAVVMSQAIALKKELQARSVRPRATVALCVVQDGQAYWAHVGDSRIYLLRGHQILERTRDHSHVERANL